MDKVILASRWFAAVSWMVVIFLLSSIPGEEIPVEAPAISLLFHFTEYFVLAVLLIWALNKGFSKVPGVGTILTVFFISTFYAFSDELHQAFVPNRVMEAADFLADSLGLAAACIVLPVLLSFVQARKLSKSGEEAERCL